MKSEVCAIIFLQLLQNKESFRFSNPSLEYIQRRFEKDFTIFSLDNFSDSLTTHYARRLLQESGETVLICEAEDSQTLGALQPLLNEAVKEKQKIRFFYNSNVRTLQPFVKFLKGKLFEKPEDLEF